MKLIWCLAVLSPMLIAGQNMSTAVPDVRTLAQYIRDFNSVGTEEIGDYDISGFVHGLTIREPAKSNFKFCRNIFNKTRQEFLKRYTPYATFGETLNNGRYNCLTGTALYALLLNHFGIKFTIIETNYHIFLLAYTDEGTTLFEATDPTEGFVTDPTQIEDRIMQYKRNTTQESPGNGKRYYSFAAELYQPVNLSELRGLLHYNISTEAYNKQDFASSINHLDKALELYSSARIAEFSDVLLKTILQCKLDEHLKESYVTQVKAIRKKLPVMASR